MIVRNEAHIILETLESVEPFISSWVIVDTGSDDGTQDLITNHMAHHGIPGELHERPWRNFGYNRTEALELAQGHGDYIWVIDADDRVVGTIDFGQLTADLYELRHRSSYGTYWLPRLFRDGLRVRYQGVVHEFLTCDVPYVGARLAGDYQIESRRLGSRNLDRQKYARDRDLLLAEVERDPEDARAVFYLAQSYCDLAITQGDPADYVNARTWYERRIEMGGWEEEVYYAKFTIAEIMPNLGASWPEVLDSYLRAWEYRPTRAEPLYTIARLYRLDGRYQLGYLFAKSAAEIPLPQDEILYVLADVYAWRASDEQAVCASWIGKHTEAFTMNRRLLTRSDIPDDDRQRIAANRDVSVPTMIEAALPYPDELVQRLAGAERQGDVALSLVAGPNRDACEQMLNSFVNCCTDVSRIGRFLVLDAGLSDQDRAILQERYTFLEFAQCAPADGTGAQLAALRAQIDRRFWLHLPAAWRFFAPENIIARLTAVLKAEPHVVQVAINLADAFNLTGSSAPEAVVRRTPDAGRYVLGEQIAYGPAMFDTARLDQAGGMHHRDQDPIAALGKRAARAGLRTASLDEVLCTAEV